MGNRAMCATILVLLFFSSTSKKFTLYTYKHKWHIRKLSEKKEIPSKWFVTFRIDFAWLDYVPVEIETYDCVLCVNVCGTHMNITGMKTCVHV